MVFFLVLFVVIGIWWWFGWFLRGISLRWENGVELVDDVGLIVSFLVVTSIEVEIVVVGFVVSLRFGSRFLRIGFLFIVLVIGERRFFFVIGLRGFTFYCYFYE